MMNNEEHLSQLTIRLLQKHRDEINSIANRSGCSVAEVARRLIEGNLGEYLDNVQYVDKEQGEAIKALTAKIYTEIANIKTELNRIGVNYNQEVKLKNLENKYRNGLIDVSGLIWEQNYIRNDCKDFSPEALQEIMDRYERISEEVINGIMAYTRITHTKNGKAAIKYARGSGKGHNGHAKRNVLIGSVGMLPDEMESFEKQMAADWEKASEKNKNQIRRIVTSYSKKELDPYDMDCAYTALQISQEFVEEAYPNRKAAIFVQNDGEGEKLHVHILVSNVDSIEHKGCTDEQTKFEYVKRHFNRTAGKHITLDYGKKAEEKLSQNERRMREENEEAAENSRKPPNYIWKDDLRERIRIAMENANTEDDFLEELENQGVSGRYGNSKRYGEYLSYELLDVPPELEDGSRKYKARSYTLGEDYGVEALREKLREKTVEQFRPLDREQPVKAVENATEEQTEQPQKKELNFSVFSVMKGTAEVIANATRREAEKEVVNLAQSDNKPQTEAAHVDRSPEKKQPVQSEKQPQKDDTKKQAAIYQILEKYQHEADTERRKDQYDDVGDWFFSK